MTDAVFQRDSYLRELEAVVTRLDGEYVELDQTIFYAEGGGQPGDSGNILNPGGQIDGDFNDTSDRVLKENIVSLSETTEDVKKLNPVSFNWKRSGKKSLGFIAQEVEEIYPDLVNNEEGSKVIKTAGIVSVLTKTVQELIEKVEAQQEEINKLKGL